MTRRYPSYNFNIPAIPTTQDYFDLNPDTKSISSSKDFVRPPGFNSDFVSSSDGGTFYNTIGYPSVISITNDYEIVYKKWVEDYVTSITDIIEGDVSVDSALLQYVYSFTNKYQYVSSAHIDLTKGSRIQLYINRTSILSFYYGEYDIPNYTIGYLSWAVTGFGTTLTFPVNSIKLNFNTFEETGGLDKILRFYYIDDVFYWELVGNYLYEYTEIDPVFNSWLTTWNYNYEELNNTPTIYENFIDLLDVDTAVLSDGDTIKYVESTGKWTATSPSSLGVTWGDIGGDISSQTDLAALFDLYIPYIGATSNIDLGIYNLTTTGTVIANNLNISNWNTAYGWGDHSIEGYMVYPTGLGLDGYVLKTDGSNGISWIALSDVATTGEYSDILNTPTIPAVLADLTDFPSGTSKQIFRLNETENAYEFFSIVHSDLGTILGNTDAAYHLTYDEWIIATTPASAADSGYLTATDWDTFNNKLDAFTPGNLLSFDGDTLNVDTDVKPVGDAEVASTDYTYSSSKIVELLSDLEGIVAASYTITIPAGASLSAKLGGAYVVPDGWTLVATGGASGDLKITHSLAKTPTSLNVYSNAAGVKTKLEGNTAYGTFTSNSSDNYIVLTSYVNADVATEIRISM